MNLLLSSKYEDTRQNSGPVLLAWLADTAFGHQLLVQPLHIFLFDTVHDGTL